MPQRQLVSATKLTCQEAVRLVSEGLDRDLPAAQKALLQAHLAVCRGCRAVRERLEFLRKAMRRLAERSDSR
jgi:predicted anti-sigma-YlaC factor YlaD